MASKNSANTKLCQGKDVLERMNFLYQASRLMALHSKNSVAASYYGHIMVGCAKKAVLRMSPDVKRTICKSCQSPMIPGKTAKVRLASKPTKMVKWTCLTCHSIKKFPTNRGYKLWAEQPEALVEFFDYTPKLKEVMSSNQFEKTHKSIKSTKLNLQVVDRTASSSNQTTEQNGEIISSEKVASINKEVTDVSKQNDDSKSE